MNRFGRLRLIVSSLSLLVFSCVTLPVAGTIAADLPILQTAHSPSRGKVVSFGSQRSLVVRSNKKNQRLSLAKVVRVGHVPPLPNSPCVVCTDGSLIAGEFVRISTNSLTLQSNIWKNLQLDMDKVSGVIGSFPARRRERDRLILSLTSQTGTRDILQLNNGDVIRGSFVSGRLQGKRNRRRFVINVQLAGNNSQLNFDQICWLRFNPALIKHQVNRDQATVLGLRDGSRLAVQQWALNQQQVELTLHSGVKLRLPNKDLASQVVFVQPLSSVTYLSNMASIGYRHLPFIKGSWKLGIDRSSHGCVLRSSGKRFWKGLGMHSYSRVVFDLGGKYREFHAELALDDSAKRMGSVVYRVFLNDGNSWRISYQSPIVRGGEKPRPIRIRLRQAQRMALIVDYADQGDTLDRANWLDARLLR